MRYHIFKTACFYSIIQITFFQLLRARSHIQVQLKAIYWLNKKKVEKLKLCLKIEQIILDEMLIFWMSRYFKKVSLMWPTSSSCIITKNLQHFLGRN